MRYARSCLLLGDSGFESINKARVLVCGLGGVGGVCVDAMYRTGFKDIFAIDMDSFEQSNQNRQLHSELVGEKKAEVFKDFYGIKALAQKIDEDFLKGFKIDDFEIIIDAIDDMKAKIALAKRVDFKKQIFLSSCGAARRIDARAIYVCSIWDSKNDAFARKYRYELRKAGLGGVDFSVVCSHEKPRCEGLGSFMGVSGSFGLMLASLALQRYLQRSF